MADSVTLIRRQTDNKKNPKFMVTPVKSHRPVFGLPSHPIGIRISDSMEITPKSLLVEALLEKYDRA